MRKSNEITVRGGIPQKPYGTDANDPNPIRPHLVTYDEARRIITTSRGRAFFVHADGNAPSVDNLAIALPVSNNVETTRNGALMWLSGAYTPSRRNKLWVRIAICSSCLFLGGST